MSAHGTRIWVLITDGARARIFSCRDGMATTITAPPFNLRGLDSDDSDVVAYRAWFKAEAQPWLSQNPRNQHVLHVSQLLLEAARERAYDRLIIIAAPAIAAQLEDALAPESRALLVGQVMRDDTGFEPEMLGESRPEIRH